MNVRTVTAGIPLARLPDLDRLEPALAATFADLERDLGAAGTAIRTCRVALSPIGEPEGGGRVNPQQAMGQVQAVAEACERLGVRWFNVPIDLTRGEHASSLDALADLGFEVLRRHGRAFVHLMVARGGLSQAVMARAARVVKAVAGLDRSGYHNFRLGLGCNIRPDTPFFPFAFSSPEPGFSLGLELPQLLRAVTLAHPGADLAELRERYLEAMVAPLQRIAEGAGAVAARHGLVFRGIDLSIAPYPEPGGSVAELMELLGAEQFGGQGTLFLTSYLTDVLRELARRSAVPTVGFGGVMFSLLEDEFMGRRAQNYGLDALILYSTVCGCGVDMVPLPGDTFDDEIAAIALDVAAASTALGKPLGIRVLPVPMKQANELTDFNMDFLYNTRVKPVRGLALAGGRLGDRFTYATR